MKQRILFIGNFLSARGGSRTVCEELALRLDADGAKVITTSSKLARIPRLHDMLRTIWSRRLEYDMSHVEVFSGPAFVWAEAACALLRFLNKPYVLALHGGNLPQFSQRNPQRVQRLLGSTEHVVVPSVYLQKEMAPYANNLQLIPNALDIGRYPFRIQPSPGPRLVWLRTFHEIYNPSLAPEVLKLLCKDFPDAHLLMVGPDKHDGSFERAKKRANDLQVVDRITFVGGVKKSTVPQWLNRGDIFLNTSNIDNTPVSVIEAMACGLCVVSTKVGGIPFLLENEKTALLVPPNDPIAMADAVRRILADEILAKSLSANARTKALEYDWAIVLPQWKEMVAQIAGETGVLRRAA